MAYQSFPLPVGFPFGTLVLLSAAAPMSILTRGRIVAILAAGLVASALGVYPLRPG